MASGYFAYRYKRKYYRQLLVGDISPYDSGDGARLGNTVPRNPSDLKGWVADRIAMLENAKTYDTNDPDDEVVHPEDGVGADDLGFNVTYDLQWTLAGLKSAWTYVIDLDNLVFTVNGVIHLRLDNMPPDLESYDYVYPSNVPIPQEYICSRVNLWPAPNFDPDERQRKYEALQPIIIPVSEWGAPTWDKLSPSQQFSIEITHYLLRKYTYQFAIAYKPAIREDIIQSCWSVLSASLPALPLFPNDNIDGMKLPPRTLSCSNKWANATHIQGPCSRMHALKSGEPFKSFDKDYCWVRGCLITLCTHLDDPIYVAHEVEQMVMKMRHDGHSESVGIILSTQMELMAVAMDGPQTRHSPVLDIRTTHRGERPGKASDGRLLLTYLLSPPLTVSPLPWRVQSHQPRTIASNSITGLPPEVLHMIIGDSL
ncbi:unnamed protein product [Rhizoctonia solani]|uniref:Uncharacterized protein n=1 Tax=Rhizoctonia solani TaxID=456999 RepID=A0A8H3E5W8_9AGAM|nr:unnamed protein product [Rhizoctonia solani]